MIVTTTIEFFTGALLEQAFHTVWWDYSQCKFNYKGRICLLNSVLFGAMCVVCIDFVHPLILKLITIIGLPWTSWIAYGLVAYFICDIFITIHTLLQLKGKLEQLQQIMDEIKLKTSAVKDGIIEKGAAVKADGIKSIQNAIGSLRDDENKEALSSLYQKQNSLEKGIKFLQRRIILAFPTMKSKKYNESLTRIKDMILGKINKN